MDESLAKQARIPIEAKQAKSPSRKFPNGQPVAQVTHHTRLLTLIISGNHREYIHLFLNPFVSSTSSLGISVAGAPQPAAGLDNRLHHRLECGLSSTLSAIRFVTRPVWRHSPDVSCVPVEYHDLHETKEEHVQHVRLILRCLLENQLFVKPEKCEFHSVTFLGFMVQRGQLVSDPSKVSVVMEWPTPASRKQLQRFLGFANFYRRFICNDSKVVAPLTHLHFCSHSLPPRSQPSVHCGGGRLGRWRWGGVITMGPRGPAPSPSLRFF